MVVSSLRVPPICCALGSACTILSSYLHQSDSEVMLFLLAKHGDCTEYKLAGCEECTACMPYRGKCGKGGQWKHNEGHKEIAGSYQGEFLAATACFCCAEGGD